ncbi:MAG: hypothetical protein AB8B87_08440 [Granulosicoccus sp.]
MKNLNKVILVTALSVVASAAAHAATQGTIGATSTGTSDVLLVKQNAVMITDVADLDLGTLNNTAVDLVASDDVCVFNSTSSYEVTVTSANAAFALSDGATGTIPYAVTWASNGGAAAAVAYNTGIGGLLGDQASTSCGGGTNATFAVSVLAADFNSADPGTYSDTLTLMIEPE